MKLFVAVTMYEDKIFGKCAESLLNNITLLIKEGHEVTTFFSSELYIDRSRNICVKNFLASDCSDMLFVDADLSFEDNAMSKIIKYDKDIVAGSYRLKHEIHNYPVILDFDRKDNNCKEEETGLVWCKSVPTGFMRIKRKVFKKMLKHYDMKADTNDIYPFFETGMRMFDDGQWWGEDTAFCKKWTDMGGEIMVEPRITFTHRGMQDFTGNFHEHLMSRSVNNLDKVPSGIEGWMTDSEIETLRWLGARCKNVVEVGSWKGRGTKELLETCKGTVYAIDHFNGTDTDGSKLAALGLNIYDKFVLNVGSFPNLKILKGDSVEMAKTFNGNKVDMVFLDAGHTYEDVIEDIDTWLPKCNRIIAGHDYCNGFPGVEKAVNEKFKNVNVRDSIWWVELKEIANV